VNVKVETKALPGERGKKTKLCASPKRKFRIIFLSDSSLYFSVVFSGGAGSDCTSTSTGALGTAFPGLIRS